MSVQRNELLTTVIWKYLSVPMLFVLRQKLPGSAVRSEYLAGQRSSGSACSPSGWNWKKHGQRGLAVCKAMGFTRVGVQQTTVEEETITDLLGEHCAWGAIVELLKTVYEVMVEGGYDEEVAFYEAVNESNN